MFLFISLVYTNKITFFLFRSSNRKISFILTNHNHVVIIDKKYYSFWQTAKQIGDFFIFYQSTTKIMINHFQDKIRCDAAIYRWSVSKTLHIKTLSPTYPFPIFLLIFKDFYIYLIDESDYRRLGGRQPKYRQDERTTKQ